MIYEKKYKVEAEKRLKVRLALQHVIKEENVEISEAEIKAEVEKMKSFYPPDQHEKIENEFKSGGLDVRLNNRLALRKLFEKVL